jgi:hypothetical protein
MHRYVWMLSRRVFFCDVKARQYDLMIARGVGGDETGRIQTANFWFCDFRRGLIEIVVIRLSRYRRRAWRDALSVGSFNAC